MIRILFLGLLLCSFFTSAQKNLEISLEGFVNDFSSKEKLYGASLYLFQDGRMVSKSLSDVKGDYYISGKIDTKIPFDIMISKPGYITKKVLLDFEDLKVQNPNGILQAMEELVIELFEIRNGVDLNFIKNTYAEKFHWDATRNIAVPAEKYKKDIEDQVVLAYGKMSDFNKSETFKKKMNSALKANDFQLAMTHVDSALFYNSNDVGLLNSKNRIDSSIKKQVLDIKKRNDFDDLKRQGNIAYSSGDYFAAEGFYKDAMILFTDNQIKYKLTKISEYKTKISKLDLNKEKLEYLRLSADSLLLLDEFDVGIARLREIQFLDPNQRMKIQSEIKTIEKKKKNSKYEQQIQHYLLTAQRLEKSKDSLDASLLYYERAEKAILNLSNQAMINTYKIEVRDGIESVSKTKLKEKGAFNQQLEMANSNFLKGPDFYDKALKILDSDLMKPYKNEREIIKLKKRILSMNQFYILKKDAFVKYNSNKSDAILDLKKALKIGNENSGVISRTELIEIKDSLTSWTGGSNVADVYNKPPVSDPKTSSSVVRSPGQLHVGSDLDAYNDLAVTMEKRKSEPLKDLQRIKNEIDYEVFFDNTVNAVRNEKSSSEMKSYIDQLEMKEREVSFQKIELQENQAVERQKLESSIKDRNEYSLYQQEASAEQIKKWTDEKDYLLEMELLNQARRNQSFEEKNQLHESERILIAQVNSNDNEQRLYDSQKHMMNLDYERFLKDSLAKMGGERRANELEKIKSFTPNYPTHPNFLKNEDGVLFPSNEMTERVFKSNNSKGFVTSVIVQRVVVDSNGYGVVFEKTTNENGSSFFSRNGASITEYIWFNESMGENVIEK